MKIRVLIALQMIFATFFIHDPKNLLVTCHFYIGLSIQNGKLITIAFLEPESGQLFAYLNNRTKTGKKNKNKKKTGSQIFLIFSEEKKHSRGLSLKQGSHTSEELAPVTKNTTHN